jgi:hypothetical protein
MLVEYLTAFDVPISRLETIQQQTCFDGVLMQSAKRDGRGCVRFGTGVPSRGKTKEAVPLEVNAERPERNAA